MKKIIVALSTLFCTILIMVSIYNFIPKEPAEMHTSQNSITYIVADYNGKVAVFEKGSTQPLTVYDIYTHLLPENDIELLRRGIEFSDMEALQHCLEDMGL